MNLAIQAATNGANFLTDSNCLVASPNLHVEVDRIIALAALGALAAIPPPAADPRRCLVAR